MHKRKHHRKPKVVRDPQQIKRVRLQRLYVKRQVCWDTRFIKETIPDLFAPKPKWRKVDRAQNPRVPLESVYIQRERPRFPDLQVDKMRNTVSTNKKKSFKIRQIRKDPKQIIKDIPTPQEKTLEKQVQRQKRVSRSLKNKQILLSKLEQKQKLFPINKRYRQLLVDLISRSARKKYKSARSIIQRQIETIGTQDNVYEKLSKMVETRRAKLSQIRQTNIQQVKLKTYIDFQMHSLNLIEDILKFKAHWEAIYSDSLHHPTRVNFYYEDKNYLSTITDQVRDIATGDPFLVERTAKAQKNRVSQGKQEQIQEKKEMMLKIRACQLLLIEEELFTEQ